jgi:transcriptional regulator with XRE-family HTH domain
MAPMKCDKCGGTGVLNSSKLTGKRVRDKRTMLKIGLRQMANEMGVSHAYLSQLEHGLREWNIVLESKANRALVALQTKTKKPT